MFEEYFSHFVFENTQIHNKYFYFFTGFTTAYNMLWKKKLFLQPHIPKEKVNTSYIRKKKEPSKSRGKHCY